MALHFKRSEFTARVERTCVEMAKRGLDGILLFQQENMYYLTGYDTFGFCFFQCLYLRADGKMALLARSADLRQAQHTSTIEDIRIWTDAAGAQPATQLCDMIESLGARGKRLGIENKSYGLTHFNGKAVDAAMDGFCSLIEATDLVNNVRLIKSTAELRYVRKAGALGDAELKAAIRKTKAGNDEDEILAAQQGAVFAGGVITRPMNLSSVQVMMHCYAVTNLDGASFRRMISQLWSGLASIATIMQHSALGNAGFSAYAESLLFVSHSRRS